MNKDNAKDYLPLVQALAEGKTIQYKHEVYDKEWRDCPNPLMNVPASRYRIKPEPRTIYYVEWIRQGTTEYSLYAHRQEKSEAYRDIRLLESQGHKVKIVEFVEKLD